ENDGVLEIKKPTFPALLCGEPRLLALYWTATSPPGTVVVEWTPIPGLVLTSIKVVVRSTVVAGSAFAATDAVARPNKAHSNAYFFIAYPLLYEIRLICSLSFRIAAKRRVRNPYSLTCDYGFRAPRFARPRNDELGIDHPDSVLVIGFFSFGDLNISANVGWAKRSEAKRAHVIIAAIAGVPSRHTCHAT